MMAATMIPIQSITLTASAASVTFSAIPQTYTDLMVQYTLRASNASVTFDVYMQFNATASGYSMRGMFSANSSSVSSTSQTNNSYVYAGIVSAANATANTFGVGEIYIPNYTVAANKPFSTFGTPETNGTSGQFLELGAGLWSNAAAITSISLYPPAGSWVAGSTVHLYGIKNS